MMHASHNNDQHAQRRLVIDLPDLAQTDLVDMVRVLTAITDAFITHHQAQLQQQCQAEHQLNLFEPRDDDIF